jgi:hypothetical protein
VSDLPEVRVTWLRLDDVECVRGHHWAGPQDERCYVVIGEGVVCEEHITIAEVTRALR